MPRFCGGTVVASRPAISTVPSSGASSPAMTRSSVDLPEPLGPSRAVSEPSSTSMRDAVERLEVAEALRHVGHGDHDWSFRGAELVITSSVASAMSASRAEAA